MIAKSVLLAATRGACSHFPPSFLLRHCTYLNGLRVKSF